MPDDVTIDDAPRFVKPKNFTGSIEEAMALAEAKGAFNPKDMASEPTEGPQSGE